MKRTTFFLMGLLTVGCAPSASPVKTYPAAPDFSGYDAAGNQISLDDYRGKVVVLEFWRSS